MGREGLRRRYGDRIGRHRDEVATPALLLDLDVAERNIATMAARFADLPAALRPHIKVHKSVELARMAVDAGAVGVACATVWEAEVMADGGIDDVLIANQTVGTDKVASLAALAARHRVTGTVDDVRNVAQLSQAVQRRDAQLELLVELDVGMGRCGVRTREELLPIVDAIDAAAGLHFRGLQAYEGHCMLEPDPDRRVREASAANEKAIDAADFLAERGHACEEISAGGTGTYYITGANPRITEVQAGSYVLLDRFHDQLVPGGFEVALTVLGTVISRQGDTVVLDCGRKAIGIDFVTPPIVAHPDAEIRYFAEEHCLLDFPRDAPLDLGDRVEVVAGYGPTTVNLHDAFHVIRNDIVVDVWPVEPRGSGPPAGRE